MFNRMPSNLLIYKNGVIVVLTMRSDLQIIFRLSTYFKACNTYFKEFLFRFPITQTFRAFTAGMPLVLTTGSTGSVNVPSISWLLMQSQKGSPLLTQWLREYFKPKHYLMQFHNCVQLQIIKFRLLCLSSLLAGNSIFLVLIMKKSLVSGLYSYKFLCFK